MVAAYDGLADLYEGNRDLFDLSEVLSTFDAHLPASGALLDLGCGAGLPVLGYFAERGWQVTGVDFSYRMLAAAVQNVPSMTPVCSDMLAVDFPADSFDAVTAVYSLFHVPSTEHPALFAKIRKWLKPGGWALLTYATVAYTGSDEFDGTREFMGRQLYYSHTTPQRLATQLSDAKLVVRDETNRRIGGEEFLWVTVQLS